MKRILFITPSPPNHLNRIRPLNILKALKGQAEVHLVCLCQTKYDYTYLEKYRELYQEATTFWQPYWRSYIKSLAGMLKGESLRVNFCFNRNMRRFLADIDIDKYDIVYLHPLRMSQYAGLFPAEKVWIDPTDCMSLYYERIKRIGVSAFVKLVAMYEGGTFMAVEKEILQTYRTIYCSRIDLDHARSLVPEGRHVPALIPNVVDLQDFPLIPRPVHSPTFNLCYWGMLKAPFNTTAVEILLDRIVPGLLKESLDFRLDIIGPNPPRRLAAKSRERVVFTGYVPDLTGKLSQMDLFVCPLVFGTGVKNKILQSLACGLPILTTSIGAEGIEGLDELAARKQLIIEDRLDRYPGHIIELSRITRTTDYQDMRNFIERRYSIEALRRILAETVLET